MHKLIGYLLGVVLISGFSSIASAKEQVREFKGNGDATTMEFEVKAPWLLDWRVNSEFTGSLALQVDLVESRSGKYVGKVVETKWVSDGVRLFNQGGHYRFKVNSSLANWTLRVEQLSPEEAKLYKSRH